MWPPSFSGCNWKKSDQYHKAHENIVGVGDRQRCAFLQDEWNKTSPYSVFVAPIYKIDINSANYRRSVKELYFL